MKGFFYPDTNHDDPEIIKRFCEALPKLKEQGVSVIFLEFLYETVPADSQMTEHHFAYCSGGRNGMAKSYLTIVDLARELEMEVIGLSRQGYYEISRSGMAQSFAYRLMGPFDGVAAWVIKAHASNKQFVVFLGSGHWPMLKHFLPTLVPVVEINESPVDPSELKESVKYLPEMIGNADRFSSGAFSASVTALDTEYSKIIDGILRQRNQNDTLDMLMAMFQDKVGLPPTAIQLNYLIVRCKQICPVLKFKGK